MDINIKYKEVDKKARIENIVRDIQERTEHGFVHNSVLGWVNVIDSLYKEDSKQIESVEIWRELIKNTPLKLVTLMQDRRTLDIVQEYTSMCLDKSELSQYIDILQQIHNQME